MTKGEIGDIITVKYAMVVGDLILTKIRKCVKPKLLLVSNVGKWVTLLGVVQKVEGVVVMET